MSTTAVAGEDADGRTLCAPTLAPIGRSAQRAPVNLRPLAIPNEHGSWGFLFEPIVLAAIAAPSLAGALVAVAAIAVFLARHPLKLAAGDVVRGRRYPRTVACAWIAAAYLIVALVAISFAGLRPLLPLAIAVPFGLVHLLGGRAALPELSGAIAMGGVAASMALASSMPLGFAAALWLLALCRSLPAILYVRGLLGRGRGAIAAHIVAIVMALLLWRASLAPFVAVLALVALLGRALVPPSKPVPKKIGVAELFWGGGTAIVTGLGYVLR